MTDSSATRDAPPATPSLASLGADADLLRLLSDALPQMVWSTRPDGFHDYYNAQWYLFTGVPPGSTDGAGWNGMFHPDDQPKAWQRWEHSLRTGEPYEIEYRLRHHSGAYRWTLGRALPVRDAGGTIVRWVGTCTDIDDAKTAAELNSLLGRELDHRIKNLFAVIAGLMQQSAKAHPQLKPLTDDLQARIDALGRAHNYVRPREGPGEARSLKAILAELLSPYPAFDDGRIAIVGDDATVAVDAATPLALTIHELATNAVKYGALAESGGTLDIAVSVEAGKVTLIWSEAAVTPEASPRRAAGFGSSLIDLAVVRQLAGTLHRDWRDAGLRVTIIIPTARLG